MIPHPQLYSPVVALPALRAQFAVLDRLAYLNAGTDGPLARRAVSAAREELEREQRDGRWQAHFARRRELSDGLRALYAQALGADVGDVALTTCTSEGMSTVIAGLGLTRGQEILTSDEEHPGLMGPLQAARDHLGVTVRAVALSELADRVSPQTALIACSHVSWLSGRLAPASLAELDVPVLLDGAQGVGAVPVDLGALGCAAYAGAGQKWLCGPDGTGMLWVSAALRDRLQVMRRGYVNYADAGAGLRARLHDDARRLDSPALSAETLACALAGILTLTEVGWPEVHRQAAALAARLGELLHERGREVVPRDRTTLVTFASPDPAAERARLAELGVIVRELPGRPWLRASVGAWNEEGDLQRLLDGLA